MLGLGSGCFPRRHQHAVQHCIHCSDWVVETKSLQERRVNLGIKSPVWKAPAPVAMSTGQLPLPQPAGGWGCLGSSRGRRHRLPKAWGHRVGSVLGCDSRARAQLGLCSPFPPQASLAAQSLPRAVPAAPAACPQWGDAGGTLCPQRGVPGTCHLQCDPEAATPCSALLRVLEIGQQQVTG